MINHRFVLKLQAFLDSECDDYDILSETTFDEVSLNVAHVTLSRNGYSVDLKFRYITNRYTPLYDEAHDDIALCMYEDCYEIVREYDWTVRYFWMKVTPHLFPVN